MSSKNMLQLGYLTWPMWVRDTVFSQLPWSRKYHQRINAISSNGTKPFTWKVMIYGGILGPFDLLKRTCLRNFPVLVHSIPCMHLGQEQGQSFQSLCAGHEEKTGYVILFHTLQGKKKGRDQKRVVHPSMRCGRPWSKKVHVSRED